jgi:hypothetical protein
MRETSALGLIEMHVAALGAQMRRVVSALERPFRFTGWTCRYLARERQMKIRSHTHSYIVELDDGSSWRIFPGDLDTSLNWKPETELSLQPTQGGASIYSLVSTSDQSQVRVIPACEKWPAGLVRDMLKQG